MRQRAITGQSAETAVGDRPRMEASVLRTVLWSAAALGLVVAYSRGISLWQPLVLYAGAERAAQAPYLLLAIAALAGAAGLAIARARGPVRILHMRLIAGVLLAGVALALPDGAFPAKRVHVPQYIVLAIVVERAYAAASPRAPVLTVACLAALLGVHDEMLQGLLPHRTFGLTDVGVNALSALAGALMCAAICRSDLQPPLLSPRLPSTVAAAFAFLAAGVFLFVLPLEEFRGRTIPFWTAAPLAAAILGWLALPSPRSVHAAQLHAVVAVAALLAAYPVVVRVLPVAFH